MQILANSKREALISRYLTAYNGMNVAEMLACLSPNVVFSHRQGNKETMRLEGLEAFSRQAHEVLPLFISRCITIMALQHHPDSTEATICFSGRLAQVPDAESELQLTGRCIFTFSPEGSITDVQDA
jgi:hypothetical protein